MEVLKKSLDLPLMKIARNFPYSFLALTMLSVVTTLMVFDVIREDDYVIAFCFALGAGIIIGIAEGVWRNFSIFNLLTIASFVLVAQFILTYVIDQKLELAIFPLQFFVLLGSVHLFYSWSWRFKFPSNTDFWRLNMSHLLRFLGATLLAALLFGAFVLIVSLIDYLFIPGRFVDEEIIGTAAIWSFLFYHPLYFMSNLLDIKKFNTIINDNVLRVAISYIFIPLMWAYMLIMFAYFIKIGIQGEWPRGGVSYWIAGLSVAGTFLYLLGYPYLKNGYTTLNKWFFKLYYILLLPILLLLFFAVYTRINAYGWTEHRYYVVALGVWLLGISLYFIWSRKKLLSVIPLTLSLVLVVSSLGPWSAQPMSIRSQYHELNELLITNGYVDDEGFHETSERVDFEDNKRIENVINFLDERSALSSFIEDRDLSFFQSIDEGVLDAYRGGLKKKLNLSSQRFYQESRYVTMTAAEAMDEINPADYDQVSYISSKQREFNKYPIEGMESIIQDSLKMMASQYLENATEVRVEMDRCVEYESDKMKFAYCCVDCNGRMEVEMGLMLYASGVLFYSVE